MLDDDKNSSFNSDTLYEEKDFIVAKLSKKTTLPVCFNIYKIFI